MSFGKDSSFRFFMQDGKLVNVGRSDNTADKQPLDSIEKEVWRIFGEWKALQASHAKLVEAIRSVPIDEYYKAQYAGCDSCGAWDCFLEDLEIWKKQALKEAEKL